MRLAAELDFEVQPTDSLEFIIDKVRGTLHKLREVNPEKRQTIKVMFDVEV